MRQKIQIIILAAMAIFSQQLFSQSPINLRHIGNLSLNAFNQGAAEISAFDPGTNRLFVVNGATGDIDMVDISNPANPVLAGSIDLAPWGHSANSVDVDDNIVAVAVEDINRQANGKVVFFNTQGQFLKFVTVGALPDMIKFSPNGKWIVVACEGEPNDAYTIDPLGIISIIEIPNINAVKQSKVANLDFSDYNNALPAGIRKFGPGATVAQDMEPEYVAISADSKTAWVTLQENNAVAIVDIQHKKIKLLVPLGFKNHNLIQNSFDASDQNNGVVDIKTWPVFGMYQPDAVDAIELNHKDYIVMANEGDQREYTGLNEVKRVNSLTLDPVAFPNAATLKNNNNLGRLNVTNTLGDKDNDGDFDELYSFGARSFSIRDKNGSLIWDSGDLLEQITYQLLPDNFNASNTSNTKKNRSDDKGPEPEGLITAEIMDSVYVFVGLERISGIMVFNITDPQHPYFVQYFTTRNFSQVPGLNAGGDLGPEGMIFIPYQDSPNGKNLLITSNEISGTISVFETDYQCGNDKVTICQSGVTQCISKQWLGLYLQNGSVLGECPPPRLARPGITSDMISIAPNPANEFVAIKFNNDFDNNYDIKIYDMRGRIIQSQTINTNGGDRVELDVSEVPSGTYLLTITGLNSPLKLIINH